MRVIAILNQKGGSGKTTTAVNLSAALTEKERRVLLLDLDPAAAASAWLGVKDGRSLLEALTGEKGLAELVQPTSCPGLEVIPSSFSLSGAEKTLAGEIGVETLLKKKVAELPSGRWDYLIVDCPPSMGVLTINALSAAREVLIPVEAHIMALDGVVSLTQTAEVVRQRLNSHLAVCGILACRMDQRTNHAREVVESLHRKFGDLLYKTRIRENVRLAECPSFGKPITQYASSSSGAEDYRSLAKELLSQEKRS